MPRRRLKLYIATKLEEFAQFVRSRSPEGPRYDMSEASRLRYIQQTATLLALFTFYVRHTDNLMTTFIAVAQLNLAEEVKDYPNAQLVAYTTMMKLERLHHFSKQNATFEMNALNTVPKVLTHVRADNVINLGSLFWILFEKKLFTDTLTAAYEYGQKAHQYLGRLPLNQLTLTYFPTFLHTMLMMMKWSEGFQMLRTLYEPPTEEVTSVSFLSTCWYYYIQIMMILSAGVHGEPIAAVLKFAETAVAERRVVAENRVAIFCLSSAICVWFARLEESLKLRDWHTVAVKYEPSCKHTANYMLTTAYLNMLECKLLEIARLQHLGSESRDDRVRLTSHIRKDLRYIGTICNQLRVLKPRFLHLNAYEEALNGESTNSFKLLTQSQDMSKQIGNIVEDEWVEKTKSTWFRQRRDSVGRRRSVLATRGNSTGLQLITTKSTDTTEDLWLKHAHTDKFPLHSHTEEFSEIHLKFGYPLPAI